MIRELELSMGGASALVWLSDSISQIVLKGNLLNDLAYGNPLGLDSQWG
jgi:hypothetical protein